MNLVLPALGWLLFVVWALLLGPSAVVLVRRTLSRATAGLAEPKDWPDVSIIVPARDEALGVEAALRSILDADYPELEVIAVDDRSVDETGAIMEQVAGEDSRLRVIHIAQLPEGWLGKTHAMHTAAQAARGELLLFTDADVVFRRDAIRKGVSYLLAGGFDHLCIAPTLVPGGYWENALVSFFGVMFTAGVQPWLARTPLRYSYVGVGAFNLVRRGAYEQTGGYETLRLEVIDDVKLGRMLKHFGYCQDIQRSTGHVSVRWQPSAWGVIRGLEKNAFAALDFSLAKLFAVTFGMLVFLGGPYCAAAMIHDTRASGYWATLLLLHVTYGLVGHAFSNNWRVFPVLPLAASAMLFAFWRSAVITLYQGGIRWRDTYYDLKTLRRGRFRDSAVAPAATPPARSNDSESLPASQRRR